MGTVRRYAENTSVPVERSRAEIERLLMKHDCTQFTSGVDRIHCKAMIQFGAYNRIVRFVIDLPRVSDDDCRLDRQGYARTSSAIETAVAQAERQRWRALLLVIKAKLESVENKISTFEEEFLAQILLPGDRTVGSYIVPKLEALYAGADVGRLLPAAPEDAEVHEG